MLDNVYAVIMCGGKGERLWPLSTEQKPKPFLSLWGGPSFFQQTVERIQKVVPKERIFAVLSPQHLNEARLQAPHLAQENYIVEPEGKNTAACLGLASLYLERINPQAIMLVLPADHYILEEDKFIAALTRGVEFLAVKDCVVTLGITPKRPETGYGYLEIGKECAPGVLEALNFLEKPAQAEAETFIARGCFLWNSGIFIWKNSLIQTLICRYMPEHWRALCRIRESFKKENAAETLKEEYRKLKNISIDYGVLEKARDCVAVAAGFTWDDVGDWTALARIQKALPAENVSIGKHQTVDTQNCIIYSPDIPVTTFGVSDLVIVSANKNILICSRQKAARLKELLSRPDNT
ncbi:MAG: sugar phosphate nucleotidyltransferase [Candidatus Omnitrophota bacterium]